MYSLGSYTAWSKRTHWLLLASSGRTTKWELSVEHQINNKGEEGKDAGWQGDPPSRDSKSRELTNDT